MPLNKLIHPSNKKIKIARKVYETYCQTGSKKATAAQTGLAYNTIRKYVDLIEDLNNKNKLSTKDRYYNSRESDTTDPIYNIYNNNNIYKEDNNIGNINNNNNYKDNVKEEIEQIRNNESDIEVFTNNEITPLNEIKNRLLLAKLTNISQKYLDYLDAPTDQQLRKTSLKDHAVIAGILLDKKILLEHKQADVIKNQSIIFNLFGNNTNLSKFITDSLDRQAKLQAKPIKKYELAVNK